MGAEVTKNAQCGRVTQRRPGEGSALGRCGQGWVVSERANCSGEGKHVHTKGYHLPTRSRPVGHRALRPEVRGGSLQWGSLAKWVAGTSWRVLEAQAVRGRSLCPLLCLSLSSLPPTPCAPTPPFSSLLERARCFCSGCSGGFAVRVRVRGC